MTNRHTALYGCKFSQIKIDNNTLGWKVDIEGAYEKPFETEPPEQEYDYLNSNECVQLLKDTKQYLENRFKGLDNKNEFPFCCSEHEKLLEINEFNKDHFLRVPEWTANKLIYTNQHISNTHKSKDYYKEITDYIDYTVESFGQVPFGGEPLYVRYYLECVITHIERYREAITDIKANKLIEFTNSYFKHTKNTNTDFNILISTYEKWLKVFPFELSFFNKLKGHFSKSLPILKGKPEINIYTGLAKVRTHTKSSLIDVLLDLTNSLITQINSHSLYERGLLTEPDKIKLELVLTERKLKLDQGYINNSQNEEQRYRSILKEWLADEKAFINDITPMLKTLLPPTEENTPPNRLGMIKSAVISNKWANYELAQMRYNSKEIWHQVVGHHIRAGNICLNHSDIELDTTNFPVITKGLTAYLIQHMGTSEQLIFDNYYNHCLTLYKQNEAVKPGSSIRNLDLEFYPIHFTKEQEYIKYSEKVIPYLNIKETTLLRQYFEAYFSYIEQTYSPKGTTENTTFQQQQVEKHLKLDIIEKWLFPFKEESILTNENYNNLVSALKHYFDNGEFPLLNNKIEVKKVNIKRFGWSLNQIFRAEKNNNEKLPIEYLRFAKENITIFKDASFNESNYLKSNLYKYFTTKT